MSLPLRLEGISLLQRTWLAKDIDGHRKILGLFRNPGFLQNLIGCEVIRSLQ